MSIPQAPFSSSPRPASQAPDRLTTSAREASIRYVKGVGPRRMDQLAALGIETLEDACYYPPRRYEDRTRLLPIRELRPGELSTVQGKVLTKGLRRARRSQTLFEMAVGDASGILYCLWFHQPYLAQQVKVGDELILYGKVEPGVRTQFIHPEMEHVEPGETQSLHMGRIVPIYPLTSGIGQRWLREVMATVLEQRSARLQDPLPPSMRSAHGWPELPSAIRELHFPSSWEALERARQRLAFDELLLLQLGLLQRRAKTSVTLKPQRYQLEGPLIQQFREQLPFTLTAGQQQVLRELLSDLQQPSPMHRLLQGDVGCGKTIVMIALMAVAVQSGYQVALMAPTELLAEQHLRVATNYLAPLGVSVTLLSQGIASADRNARAAQIASGEIQVVIGTHALIQRNIAFKRLALVMIDEQHKFGVGQRVHLAKKADVPDVLIVTATPIPRTLALTMYGDLEISTIHELPPGRAPITTRWMCEAERETLYAMIREQLAQGRQGYVVYPLVEEQATKALRAATQMAKRLQADVFPEVRVGLLHGQMKPAQKEQTMRAFAQNEIRLLISTVIVEVGLDIPNATIMVIEHPERFGLAQLHQLRGRIGRSTYPATCVVISDSHDALVQERLQAFVRTGDGFHLAEKDLELRGPGELRGNRQHGWLRFRIADLLRDHELLELARQEATALIKRDPALGDASLSVLRQRLAAYRQALG